MAQMNEPSSSGHVGAMPVQTLGTVTNGGTTIEFQNAASNSDINQQDYAKWGDFAEAHPNIARALAYKPSLMNDAAYLRRHPELSDFFDDNPRIRDAMGENPGDFVAIPPRPGE
jgi:hypothetical protein